METTFLERNLADDSIIERCHPANLARSRNPAPVHEYTDTISQTGDRMQRIDLLRCFGISVCIDETEKRRSKGYKIKTICRSHSRFEPIARRRAKQVQKV